MPGDLERELVDVVGGPNVLADADVVAGYCVDWTGRFRGTTPLVVRPASTEEVAAVVRACRSHGGAIVPQGGNTGLVGGGVPLAGEIVLSLTRMAAVDEVDVAAGQVTAEAGASIARVREAAARAGSAYGIDLASRDSATVGGTIATNAAGLRAVRFGDTRAQVAGVEAVLGDGSVVSHLAGLARDNTGYHLPSLLCGSEGTLAVVTRARLRLVPPPADECVTALVAFSSVTAAADAVGALRRGLPALDACELVLARGVDLVRSVTGAASPFSVPFEVALLVESGGDDAVLGDVVGSLGGAVDAAVAVDAPRRAALWDLRERHTEAINTLGPPHKLDVSLPLSRLAEFIELVPSTVETAARPQGGVRTWIFGHAADGNLHVNVSGLDPADERVDDAVLRLVAAMDGSISAEHGIGTAKRRWLHLNRSETEIAAMRAIKRALDPDGILNPNVLLP